MAQWKSLQVSRRGVALDHETGESFCLNGTAAAILNQMQNGLEAPAIAQNLVSLYGIKLSEALTDVYDFESKLYALGLDS